MILFPVKFSAYQKESAVFAVCFIGVAMVYLTHLGVVPIHAMVDECRRALVAMEMCISGDYLRPTINGEAYLNKPPLFSWIIALSYHVFGNYSAFALRFPVVISILGHGLLIYFIVKRYCSSMVAAMTSLAFMTNGRTLIFDSLLGLVEHTLALSIYAGFVAIFILGEKKKYLLLFAISYFAAALGFMIKGLPALAHHGMALLVYFISTKKVKLLFSRYHLAGIILFLLTLAFYYIPYFMHGQVSPKILFSTILHQSSKRYNFNSIGEFFHILLYYPVDFIYYFLPWTIFIVLLVRKNVLATIKENKFVYYNFLFFIANIPIYWFASLKNPHYLYFLLPMLFTFLFYSYYKSARDDWRVKLIDKILYIGIGVALILEVYLPFSKLIFDIPGVWVKSFLLFTAFLVFFYLFPKTPSFRLFLFVGTIIFIRLAFNWFVIPQRISSEQVYVDRAAQVYQIVGRDPLYIMASYPAGFYDGITFFMEKARKEILSLNPAFEANAYYLVDDVYLNKFQNEVLLHFPYEYADNHQRYNKEMYLVKWIHD